MLHISAKQVISDCMFAGFCKLLLLLHIHSQTKVELGAFSSDSETFHS